MPRVSIIENREGLKKYLNNTTDVHNQKDYDDFVACLIEQDMPPSHIAHIFFVDTRTVKSWIQFYEKESSDV